MVEVVLADRAERAAVAFGAERVAVRRAVAAAPAAPSSSARLMFASPGPANGAVPEQE